FIVPTADLSAPSQPSPILPASKQCRGRFIVPTADLSAPSQPSQLLPASRHCSGRYIVPNAHLSAPSQLLPASKHCRRRFTHLTLWNNKISTNQNLSRSSFNEGEISCPTTSSTEIIMPCRESLL